MLSLAEAAVPVQQILIDGAVSSDYTLFIPAATNRMLDADSEGNLVITESTGDEDADGLPDWWEMAFFVGRTNANPMVDDDSDKMNNWSEYIAGTDPQDRLSLLLLEATLEGSSEDPLLRWPSAEGRRYTLHQWSHGLIETSSVVMTDIPATPPMNSFPSVIPSGSNVYYQIEVQP